MKQIRTAGFTATAAFLMFFIAIGSGVGQTDPFSIEMVDVAGGTFTMGCTPDQEPECQRGESEKPARQVTLSDFQIGKYEVTQAQWKRVMGEDNNPSNFKGDNLPVAGVTWDDAQEFIRKLNEKTGGNYRLPTEAEWEYAARGGNKSQGYKYSGSSDVDEVAWINTNSERRTHPVGTKKANELGIHDMSGNVYEWVNDWYGDYSADQLTDPQGPSSGSGRVLRGGHANQNAGHARPSFRRYDIPDHPQGYNNIGFRLAISSK